MTDYKFLDTLGLCHKCRRKKVAPGKKYCFDCLEQIRECSLKRYDPEKAKEYQSRRREIYREKKEKGICVRCNKPATHGIYCYECSIKAKRHNQKNAEKQKAARHERGLIPEKRREQGLCLWCGKPIEDDLKRRGFLVCRRHRKLFSEYSKKAENCPIRLAIQADIKKIKAKKVL